MNPGYTLTLMPDLTDPLVVTRLSDQRDLPVTGPTLAAAADAILRDYLQREPTWAEVRALIAVAFGGLDERGVLAVTVRAAQLERVCEAVGRVA